MVAEPSFQIARHTLSAAQMQVPTRHHLPVQGDSSFSFSSSRPVVDPARVAPVLAGGTLSALLATSVVGVGGTAALLRRAARQQRRELIPAQSGSLRLFPRRAATACRAVPKSWLRLPQEVRANLASVSEEDLKEMAPSMDPMAPYRGIVTVMGLVFIVGALRDVIFLLMRFAGMNFMASPTASAMTANEILAIFLVSVGGGLLYAAAVWMKPELPTVDELKDLLREEEDDDLEDLLDDLLPGKEPDTPSKVQREFDSHF
eukprot:TRINITY_DN106479_c0_g1_i1.p1 TRINITY_DN106479_c0_g1~~TRINITY_DN106479_c0_g1_i1.p1  ORF type:complete len:280 (+),score=38.72 TRINITY_DN106479_c0_g1_i1:61-840(+)